MSSTRLNPALCAAALLAVAAGSIAAQAAPTVALGKTTAKSKYTLGYLFSIQELADGRVVASDTKENIFRLVNLSTGEVGSVGKQGDDADSYRSATLVLRLPGDSLALFDPAGRKLVHVTPQGEVARMVPLPTMSNGRRIGTPLAMDQNGSIYFTVPERFDTVTRQSTGIGGLTRIGMGADADEPQMTYRARRADQVALKGRMPYIFKDGIAVRSDGLMARVVSDSYQVVWGRNGKEVGRTGPIPYTPIALTKEEVQATKDSANAFMKQMLAGGGRGGPGGATSFGSSGGMAGASMGGGGERIIVMGGGGGGAPMMVGGAGGSVGQMITREIGAASSDSARRAGGGNTTVMNGANINPADLPWGDFPDVKPPIPSQGTVAMFDATGNLWVARTGKVGDPVPHYDVIAEGKGLIGHVDLPKGTRLLGFGRNAVYLARNDEGSDWLERYAMPKLQ